MGAAAVPSAVLLSLVFRQSSFTLLTEPINGSVVLAAVGPLSIPPRAPEPGELTFSINRLLLRGGLTVTDDEVRSAIEYAFRVLKLVVKPGGAVALAALLSGKVDVTGKTIGVVLSGGNVDPALYVQMLSSKD